MHNGNILFFLYITALALRMPPIRAFHKSPPLSIVIQSNGVWRFFKHQRTCDENGIIGFGRIRRQDFFHVFPFRHALGNGYIMCRVHKFLKLGIGHFRCIHPKAIEFNGVFWIFIGGGLFVVTAHQVIACGNPHHPLSSRVASHRNLRCEAVHNRFLGQSVPFFHVLGYFFIILTTLNRHYQTKTTRKFTYLSQFVPTIFL